MSLFESLRSLIPGAPIQIGIDVGGSAVKVVAIRNSQSETPRVVGVGYHETPLGCVVDGVLNDPKTMAEIIKSTLFEAGINFKDQPAAVGLRGHNVLFKRLLLPHASPEDMNEQVLLEAQQSVDSDLADWIIDYQPLTTPDDQGQVSVMLVNAKRSGVEDFLALLQTLGVKPDVFDCDIFSIQNSLEKSFGYTDTTILCIDIGKDTTNVNIIQNKIPIIVRAFPIGGAHFTEQISKILNIDVDQAESIKISFCNNDDFDSQKGVLSAHNTHLEEFCEEVKRTLDFFASTSQDVQLDVIDKIVLSGGGSGVKGLPEKLGKLLDAEVVFAQPFRKCIVEKDILEKYHNIQHVFNVAFGLSLRFLGDSKK